MAIKQNNAGKSKAEYRYIPLISQLPTDMKFHYKKDDGTLGIKAKCTLVKSIDELKELAKEFVGVKIAVDTETTGLSFNSDEIVGFSISKDGYSGIYVPIRHEIKRVDKRKTNRLDPDTGEIMYTKAGKPRQVTVEDATFFPCNSNLPAEEALNILYDIMKNARLTLLHNSDFDLNMIKKEGLDITKVKTFDTMILPYLYDPEGRGILGLKLQAKLMGRYVPEFKDVLGKEENFKYVDPELGYEYACYDSANTYAVFERLYPMVKALLARHKKPMIIDGKKYEILTKDNDLIRAFVDYYDHIEIDVDRNVAIDYRENIIHDLKEVSESIYTYFKGGQFNLSTASKEFKEAMARENIVTGAFTDKGAISFGKNGIKEFNKNMRNLKLILDKFEDIKFNMSKLDKRSTPAGFKLYNIISTYGEPYFNMKDMANSLQLFDKKDNHLNQEDFYLIVSHMYEKEKEKLEVLENIQKNSSLNKAMNSYVDKLTKVDKCRMKYKLLATSSSRLASGNGSKSDKRKNDYYIDLNAQNLTKPKSCFYEAIESDDEDSILGWKFTEVSDKYAHKYKDTKIIVEGSSVKANIRNCFIAPKGRYVMSRDYSSQEYLTLAILSKDTKMLTNFKKGLDPHTSTAYAIWGEENYTKDKRKKAKTCLGRNSFVLTGGGLVRPYDLSKSSMIVDRFGNSQRYAMETDYGKLIEVQYSTGVVEEYTPNHRVQVWSGKELIWKEVQHLTPDDEVVQMCGVHNVCSRPNLIDTRLQVSKKWGKKQRVIDVNSNGFAYLAGVYLDSGRLFLHATGRAKFVSLKISDDTKEKALEALTSMGIDTDKYCRSNKEFNLIIAHSPLCTLLKQLFGDKRVNKKIPDYVFSNWDKFTISNMLTGMLDSGSTVNQHGYTTYNSTNLKLVQSICLLSSLIGVKTNMACKEDKLKDSILSYYRVTLYGRTHANASKLFKETLSKNRSTMGRWTIDKEFMAEFLANNKKSIKCAMRREIMRGSETKESLSITGRLTKRLSKDGADFPLKYNMQCAKVISKKETEGEIYIIETTNHEYVSSCIVSHNCNFLINYGGNEYGLANTLEIPVEEAKEIIVGYETAFFECIQWKKNEIQKMYSNSAVVFTEFGRPRQFGSWLRISANMEDMKAGEGLARAVERRVASHQIQGFCGDICRNVLLKLYTRFFKHRDPDIDFMSTVHDEVNFSVTKEKLIEYARECEDIMKFDVLMKELPISTSLDVGYSYGNCYPFVWEDDTRTKLIPKTI